MRWRACVGFAALVLAHATAGSSGLVSKLTPAAWLEDAQRQLLASATANTPECSRDYGAGYVARWRALQGSFCNASSSGAAAAASSSVHCHAHPEADLSTCVARHVLLASTPQLLGAAPAASELPQPQAGALRLACARTAEPGAFLRGRLASNEGSRAWLVQAPAFAGGGSDACAGAAQRVEHAVLLLLRVDPSNAFHHVETIVSVFAALAVLQLPPQLLHAGLEVVVADDRAPGLFLDVWRRVSWPHPLRLLRQRPFPAATCFSTLVLAPYAPHTTSLLTYKAGSADEVLCESVLLQATSAWLRHLFRDVLPLRALRRHPPSGSGSGSDSSSSGDQLDGTAEGGGQGNATVAADQLAPLAPSPAQAAAPLEQLFVVWLSRRRYEQQHAVQLSGWQRARALSDEQQEQLVAELQRTVLRWNAQTCAAANTPSGCHERGVLFTLQVAELSELSFFPDQLTLLARTGVLAGVHGAGLANQVFMQPRHGAVVEVWYGMDSNYHYHNMAHMLGHAYRVVACPGEGELDVAGVAAAVAASMDAVAAGRAAAAGRRRRAGWWWRRRHGGAAGAAVRQGNSAA